MSSDNTTPAPESATLAGDDVAVTTRTWLDMVREFIGEQHSSAIGEAKKSACSDAHYALDRVVAAVALLEYVDGTPASSGQRVVRVQPRDAGDDVAVMRLPCALLNRLANADILTVGQLAACSERDLHRTRGIGAKFIVIIKSELAAAGFQLRGEADQ